MTPQNATTPRLPARRAWYGLALETLVALAAAGIFLASCTLIRVYPVDRLGQISGLASLALRFFLFGMVAIAALVIAARVRSGRGLEMTTRLVCAGVAGIVGGMMAGGIMIALRNTPWGLNALGGDMGVLAERATALHRGEPVHPAYPPLSLHVLHLYSDLMGLTPAFALKHLQILGTAAFGPVAYLSWRLVMRPVWALAIGVIAMLPLIDSYKPFANLVLVVFVPLAILFLDTLRTSATRTGVHLMQASMGFGLAFGVLCLTYSGWFQWAAPGLLVATLVVFPWREAPRKGAMLLVLTGVAFALIAGRYVAGLLGASGKIADDYVYFDVKVEPMYIAMWRGDTPGEVGVWPPIGELGGVGLFTILLLVGFGLAIVLARRTTLVIGATAMMLGAWLMRFAFARLMWETKLVQLYPRTTPLILYCLLAMTGFVVYLLLQRIPDGSPLRRPSSVVGVMCALLLFFASTSSALADRYMPSASEPHGPGFFAYSAHVTKWAYAKKVRRSTAMPWIRRSVVDSPKQ